MESCTLTSFAWVMALCLKPMVAPTVTFRALDLSLYVVPIVAGGLPFEVIRGGYGIPIEHRHSRTRLGASGGGPCGGSPGNQ